MKYFFAADKIGQLQMKIKTSLSLAEAQSLQRKTRYAGDQNCEKAQFWSHFMLLRCRSKFYPQGVQVCRYEFFSHTGKETCPLSVLSVSNDPVEKRGSGRETIIRICQVYPVESVAKFIQRGRAGGKIRILTKRNR